MQRRPKTLDVFAYFLFLIALSFPIQVMLLYEHDFSEFIQVLEKLTFLNWAVIGLAIGNIYLLFKASPLLRITLPVLVLTVLFNNIVVGLTGTDYSGVVATLSTLGFIFSHVVLWQPAILLLLKHPDRRWWLTPPRKELKVTTFIDALNGPTMKAKTFDISDSGAFFPIPQKSGLQVGDRLMLSFSMGSLSRFRCEAQVVRSTSGTGRYPEGIGVRFENLPLADKYNLRQFIDAHG